MTTRNAPWIAGGLTALLLAGLALPRADREGQPAVAEFGRLPVLDHGRVKPMDSVARNALLAISSRQSFSDEDGPKPPVQWLLDVMSSENPFTGKAAEYKVFRIENEQVLDLLGLEPRPGSFRYSLREIAKGYDKFEKELARVQRIEPKNRALFDEKVFELAKRLNEYQQLIQKTAPLAVPPAKEGGDWTGLSAAEEEARNFAREAIRDEIMKSGKLPKDMNDEDRQKLFARMEELARQKQAEVSTPAGRQLGQVYAHYRDYSKASGDDKRQAAEAFNRSLAEYKAQAFAQVSEADVNRAGYEAWLNHFAPFYYCSGLYVVAFLLVTASWLGLGEWANRSASAVLVVTLAVHTLALFSRMYLMDRPLVFVTNLYSSAVFIGWACVGLGLVLEKLFRQGIGNALSAVTGFTTLVIAYNLASGDTMDVLQAVLDTNFWLATHVTTVTLGYSATFFAGFLGIVYVLRGVFTHTLTPAASKDMARMIYGIVCFATLLSFVGTVLGGIWADQSWGRFWGWDPKENGALLIVLWNALVLHARWGGMVRDRGMAVLAIGGNVVTSWSWFGTNMLGVGLHSYGFMEGAFFWLIAFVLSQLTLIGLGLVPVRYWSSHTPGPTPAGERAVKRGEKAEPAAAS